MEEMQAKVEQNLRKRFKKELFNNFCKAIDEYDLIQAGDKIAVCISGGKDSMLMAKLFQELQRRWTYRENRVKKDEIQKPASACHTEQRRTISLEFVQNKNKDEILRLATLAQNDIGDNAQNDIGDNAQNDIGDNTQNDMGDNAQNDIENNAQDIENNNQTKEINKNNDERLRFFDYAQNDTGNKNQKDKKNLQCHTDQTRTTVRVRGSISKTKEDDKNNKNITNCEDKQQGFELVFLVMDPGYNKENRDMIEHNAKMLGVPITIFETNIFNSVVNVEKSPCYLCARMRRGYLYSKAKELGCNKIALGHHYNDVIETILMGMLFSGQFQTMLPKLNSTNFEGMQLIRPMYLIKEKDILHWRDYCGLKFLQCACRFTEQTNYSSCTQTDNIEDELTFDINNKSLDISNKKTCGNDEVFDISNESFNKNIKNINSLNEKENKKLCEKDEVLNNDKNLDMREQPTKEQTSMRKFTKQLIAKLNKLYPQIETNIFKSVENVNLSTLISYKDKSGTHSFKDNL